MPHRAATGAGPCERIHPRHISDGPRRRIGTPYPIRVTIGAAGASAGRMTAFPPGNLAAAAGNPHFGGVQEEPYVDPTLAQAVVAAGLAAMGLAALKASLAPRPVPVRVKASQPRRD